MSTEDTITIPLDEYIKLQDLAAACRALYIADYALPGVDAEQWADANEACDLALETLDA